MPRKRDIPHYVYVNQEEELLIRSNMAKLNMNNFSKYARRMLLEGKISNFNLDDEKQITRNMVMIGNNLNQIARKVNTEDQASREDIKHIIEEWQEFKKYYSEMMKKLVGKSKYNY